MIKVGRNHLLNYHESGESEFPQRIQYHVETIEEHNMRVDTKYDAVVVSEVLEHVDDKESFLQSCTAPLLPGGSIFITTFNKSTLSWIYAIVFAEYMFKAIPRGTHDWNKFISPLETQRILERCMYFNFKRMPNWFEILQFGVLISFDFYEVFDDKKNINNSNNSILGGCLTILCNGFQYEFWRKKWIWTKHEQFSYALQALKS